MAASAATTGHSVLAANGEVKEHLLEVPTLEKIELLG